MTRPSSSQRPLELSEAVPLDDPTDIRNGDHLVIPDQVYDADGATVISSQRQPATPTGRPTQPVELGSQLSGERLNHFELRQFVGGGGMGAVFRAFDTML